MQHELKKFLAVTEATSISEAAKKLNISQPALSISIKNLEKQLGVELFQRRGGQLMLTPAGVEVKDAARRMQLEMINLQDSLSELKDSADLIMKVGMIDSIGSLLLPYLNTISINLDVTIDSSPRLVEMLSKNSIDLAFIVSQQISLQGNLSIKEIGYEPFTLVCQPQMYSKLTRSIASSRLLPNFLSYNARSTTHYLMLEFFEEIGLSIESDFSSTSPEILNMMAKNGKGCALLPFSLVESDISNGYLSRVDIFYFKRPISVVHHRSRNIHESLEETIKAAQNLLG